MVIPLRVKMMLVLTGPRPRVCIDIGPRQAMKMRRLIPMTMNDEPAQCAEP